MAGAPMRLHHVQLAMPREREKEARHFYSDLLGLLEVEKPETLRRRGGAWFRGPGIEIHLGVEDDFRPARKAHPGILVAEIEELARKLAEAGREVTWDPDFPGFRRFYSADPFGNRLEFLQAEAGDA
ncbi:MAG: VOC family protein [Candidatus Dormiibacterota bacterium]